MNRADQTQLWGLPSGLGGNWRGMGMEGSPTGWQAQREGSGQVGSLDIV